MTTETKINYWLNTDILYYDDIDVVRDYCENSYPEREIPQEDSEAWWDILSYMRDRDLEDFWGNMEFSKFNRPCIVTGTLGLWWGRPDICPKYFLTLVDALSACFDKMDDAQCYIEDGVIIAVGLHHDGRNHFEIRPIKEKYREQVGDWFYYEDGDYPFAEEKFYDKVDDLY